MLSEVERLTGQTIPSSILFEARTIRQLAQKLSIWIYTRSPSRTKSKWQSPAIVPFSWGPSGGRTLRGKTGRLPGSDQPLFVVAPHDLGDKPDFAPDRRGSCRPLTPGSNAQPEGPYRLSGYCLGGLVAFEVARLLVAAGEKVEMVGMIDSPTINGRRSVQLLLSATRRVAPDRRPDR